MSLFSQEALNLVYGEPQGAAPSNVQSFVDRVAPLAQTVGERLNVDPAILIGQWGLETGWGKSVVPGTNNLGNIKDFSGRGPMATDNMTGSRDAYRAYDSLDAFGDDYAGLIERRYRGALGAGSDAEAFARALKSGGYAEDPDYVAKMVRAARMAGGVPVSQRRETPYQNPLDALPQGGNSPMQRALEQDARQQAADDAPISTSFSRGWEGLKHNAGLFVDTLADDAESAAQRIAAKREYDAANPAPTSSQEFLRQWDELADDDYLGMLATFARNPGGAVNQMVEQTPNSLPGLALQIPTAIASGALFATGWGAPLAIALQGAAAFAGNVLPEGGAFVEEQLSKSGVDTNNPAAVAQWLSENRDANLAGGATKAGVISLADGVAGYLGGKLIAGPSARFGMADRTILRNAGVDVADRAAANAFRATEPYRRAIAPAAQELLDATTGAKKLLRATGAMGLESFGEGAGEYGGSLAATGEASAKDAVLEAAMGFGQSTAMTGANALIGKMQRPAFDRVAMEKLAASGTPPAAPKPNSPLQNAANAAAASAPPVAPGAMIDPVADPAAEQEPAEDPRLARARSFVEDRNFISALRGAEGFGKESVTDLLSAYAKARNPNVDPLMRERALADLDAFIDTFVNRPNFTFGKSESQQGTAPGQSVVPASPAAGQVAPFTPAAPADDGMTLDGEFRTPSERMAGANPNQLAAPPVLGLPTEEALQARRDAEAAYDQAFQDLVKAEQLGASEAELGAYQRALFEADAQRKRLDAELAAADARVADARERESQAARRAILAGLIEQGIPAVNPVSGLAASFTAALQQQGYGNIVPTADEMRTIQRAVDVANAQGANVEPAAPNEMPAELVPARAPTVTPTAPRGDKTDEVVRLLSQGWKLNGKTLVSPRGKRRILNLKEQEAVRNAQKALRAGLDPAAALPGAAQSEAQAAPGTQGMVPAAPVATATQEGGVTDDVPTTEQVAAQAAEAATDVEQQSAIERHGLPEGTTFSRGKGMASGKWIARAGDTQGNMVATIDEAASSLAQFLQLEKRREENTAAMVALSKKVADKLKRGEQPTDVELRDLFGLDPRHTYVKQSAVGQFLVDYMGVPRNKIRESLGKAAGTVTSDSGTKYPIVYPRKLHEVFGATKAADDAQAGDKQADRFANNKLFTALDAAAHEAATSPLNDLPQPTDEQKKAGNYVKGSVRLHGMDISIENPQGSVRSGTAPDGTRWENRIAHHYGYIKGSRGADNDQIDVFLTDGAEEATVAWVIDQKNDDGSFDEHKAVIGPKTEDEARAAYLANYDEGWDGLGAITSMPMEAFKAWALDGKRKRKALAYVEPPKEFVHNGVRIYPTTINAAGEARLRWGVESAENKARREAGERYGFGDSLRPTIESAMADADRQIQRDAERAELEQLDAEIEALKQGKAAARKADTINGFLDGKAPNTQELIRKALDKQYRFDGVVRSVREQVEWLSANGALEVSTFEEPKIKPMSRTQFNRATQREQDAHEKKMREAGTKTVYLVGGFELGKYAYDYAQHLLARKVQTDISPDTKPAEAAPQQAETADTATAPQPLTSTPFATFEQLKTALKIVGDVPAIQERLRDRNIANIPGKGWVNVPNKLRWDEVRANIPVRIETYRLDGVPARLADVTLEVMESGAVTLKSRAEVGGYPDAATALRKYVENHKDAPEAAEADSPSFRTVKSKPFADEASSVLALMDRANNASTSQIASDAVRKLAVMAQDSGDATARGIGTFLLDNALEALNARKINAGTAGVTEARPYQQLKASIERLRDLETERVTRGDQAPAVTPDQSTHKDPGQPAEPVTQPVIAQAIQRSARNTAFDPVEAKAWILGEIDRAIAAIPERNAELAAEMARAKASSFDYKEAEKKYGKNGARNKNALDIQRMRDDRIEKIARQIGYVTFDVPGDGKFKVLNTVEKLRDFRAKVEKSPGFAKNPDRPSRFGGQGLAGAQSLDQQVADAKKFGGDPLADIGNAIEIARLKDGKDEDRLLDRFKEASGGKDYDTWRAEQEAAEEIAAREAEAREQADQGDPQALAQMMAMYDQPSRQAQQPEPSKFKSSIAGVRQAYGDASAFLRGRIYSVGVDNQHKARLEARLVDAGLTKREASDVIASAQTLKAQETRGAGPMTFLQLKYVLRAASNRELIEPVDTDGRPVEVQQPEQPAQRYAGPVDVSSRDGQMELAYRAGTIAALKAMNAQLRAIAPDEAWADANIEEAADLDALRNQISEALVRASRASEAEQSSPLRKRLEEASGADLRAVFDALGLAGGARMTQLERVEALMREDARAVSDALDDVQKDGEPAAADAPAEAPAANQPALTGPRRNPAQVSAFTPYLAGDIVTIDGQDWQVQQDMDGWYLTSTGNWRGMHPTIQKIRSMNELIAEIERAATAQVEAAEQADAPTETEPPADDLLTPDQARALMTWDDLGQRDNVKRMRLSFFENAEDMAAKRGAMNYGTIESYQGGKWNIDGTTYPTLKAAKAAAVERAIERLRADGYVGQAGKQPVTDAAQPAAENTRDAGEELTYNKRNRRTSGLKWEDVSDKNAALRIKEVVKTKVYPKPDYAALVEGGMQPIVAHIVKQAYDAIAPAPKLGRSQGATPSDEVLQSYIGAVNRVMEGVLKWANDPEALGQWAARQSRLTGIGIAAANPSEQKTLLGMIYPKGWKESRDEIIMLGGNKFLGALQPGYDEVRRAMKDVDKGWPSKLEAWQKQGYKIVDGADLSIRYYEGRRRGETPFVSIIAQVGNDRILVEAIEGAESQNDASVKAAADALTARLAGKQLLLDKRGNLVSAHETTEAAQEAAREQTKREQAGDEISEKGISVEMAERVGAERRMPGEDVSSERIMETFGFRGINFGNWMKGDTPAKVRERQLHLNHLYDAFLDLAEILNVPPKAMSLNGMLGIAVGAQGSGKHLAHFVPGVNEINITRTAGAGALAHEWGHALDHYFARQAGLERNTAPFLTEHVGRMEGRVEGGKYVRGEKTLDEGLRPEIAERFKAIIEAMERRDETQEEYRERMAESVVTTKRMAASEVDSVKEDLRKAVKGTTGSGIDAALEKIDAAGKRIAEGDVGEGAVAWKGEETVLPVVREIMDVFEATAGSPMADRAVHSLQYMTQRHATVKGIAEAADRFEPRKVPTNYKSESNAADAKKKPYWATRLEMFARAFDAYVVDSLDKKAAKNTYLSGIEAVPPRGDERKIIGDAFDTLVGEMRTRETEQGVALYEIDENGDPSAEEAQAVQAGIERLNPIEAADWLAQNAPPQYAAIAAKVRDKLESLRQMGMRFGLQIVRPGDTSDAGLSRARGATWTTSRDGRPVIMIALNGADMKGRVGTSYRTALHELSHAATLQSIRLGEQGYPQYAQAAYDLRDVANAVVAHINRRASESPRELTEFERAIIEGRANFLSSLDEVVTWALTSPDAQAYLEGIPYKRRSLWTAFVEAVRKLLGLSAQGDTALSEVLRVAEVFLQPVDAGWAPALLPRAKDGRRYEVQQPADGAVFKSPGSVPDAFVTDDGPAVFRTGDPMPDTITVDGIERPTANSEGRPIHPSVEGVRNFWRWFGESAVTDDQGRPLVVYHGTYEDFDVFEIGNQRSSSDEPSNAFYFTSDESAAKGYAPGGDVIEAYISMDRPLDLRTESGLFALNSAIEDDEVRGPLYGIRPPRSISKENLWNQILESEPDAPNDVLNGISVWARDNGYDGLVFIDGNRGDEAVSYAVFRPEQIKSATGNNGDFSADPSVSLRTANEENSRVGFSRVDADRFIEDFLAATPNAPEIVAVNTFDQLPAFVQQEARNQGETEKTVKGVLVQQDGATRVYVVVGNHASLTDFEATIFHEVAGHFGMREMLGPDFTQKLNQIYLGVGGQGGLVKIMNARGLGKQVQNYIRAIQQAQRTDADNARKAAAMGRKYRIRWTDAVAKAVLTEEVYAHIAEQLKDRPALLDKFKALIGALRQWLRDHTFMRLASLGETDLLYMLSKARKELQGPSGGPKGGRRTKILVSDRETLDRDGERLDRADPDLASAMMLARGLGLQERDGVAVFAEQSDQDAAPGGSESQSVVFRVGDSATIPRDERRDYLAGAASRNDGPLRQFFTDLFAAFKSPSSKVFGPLHKSISTQLHKAWVNKDYGEVFYLADRYERDISRFSAEPSALAPKLLPTFDKIGDAFDRMIKGDKVARMSDKVANAIFEGTLAGATPTEGRVWTNQELRDRFELDDAQIELYREARKTTDLSLDISAAGLAWQMVKKYIGDLKEAVRTAPADAAKTIELSMRELEDQLREEVQMVDGMIADAENEGEAAKLAANRSKLMRKAQEVAEARIAAEGVFKRAEDLKAGGYFPLMRFGKYNVDVTIQNEDGETERLGFYKFETEAEAKMAEQRLRREFPEANIERSISSEEAWKVYQGVDPETVALFAEHIGSLEGLDVKDDVLQAWYREAVNNRSAFKRMIHRKGTEGFDRDLTRVLASFVTSNARLAARQFNMPDIAQKIADLKQQKAPGDVVDEAERLRDYIENPEEPFQSLKGWMFAWFLGGSISSALLNATQPFMVTLPYLSQFGATQAAAELTKAMKGGATGSVTDAELQKALLRAAEDGKVDPQQVHHLFHEGMRPFISKLPFGQNMRARAQGLMTAWGYLFGWVENFNRRSAFIAAYRMAKANPKLGDAYEFAVRAVDETQGVYGKSNRPNWARGVGPFGGLGVAAFVFKQYSIAYVELLIRMAKSGPAGKRAALMQLGILVMLAGLQGLPGADDLEDLIDTAAQHMGYTGNSRLELHRYLKRVLGEEFGNIVQYGLLSAPMLRGDMSSRVGLGDLFPATAIFKPSQQNRASQIAELFGPPASMGEAVMKALEASDAGGGALGILKALTPVAVSNAWKGVDMAVTGRYNDTRGRKVVEVDMLDAALKGVGIQPSKINAEQRPARLIQLSAQRVRQVKSNIHNLRAQAIVEKNADKRRRADEMLRDWNAKNPDARLSINSAAILRRVKEMNAERRARLMKTLPKELRQSASEEYAH